MKSFRLTEEEMEYLADRYPTPFMVVSLDRVEKNYRYLCEKLPRVKVFYAIKANSEPAIIAAGARSIFLSFMLCPSAHA